MLTRAEFCQVTDVEVSRLKSLALRGQLPFRDDIEISATTTEVKDWHGWRRYRPFDAILLILVIDLAREGGLSLDEACRAIGNTGSALYDDWSKLGERSVARQLWVGFVGNTDRNRRGKATYGRAHVAGNLEEIARKLAAWEMAEAQYRLVLANASEAFQHLLRRARAAGISLPDHECRDAWMATWQK